MISYAWCERLDDEDLAEAEKLVTEAAEYDAEAGFTTIDPRLVHAGSGPGHTVRHLPVKARRELSIRPDAPVVMVAYLHLSIDEHGQGSAALVVHPRYRSRGVATSLVEELGLEVSARDGWCGTGATSLRGWAFGSHPASERLTRRFGVRPVARLWTVLRHLSGPMAVPLTVDDGPGDVSIAAHDLADPATAKRVTDVLARGGLTKSQFEQFSAEFADRSGGVLLATGPDGCDVGFVWFDPSQRIHLELRTARVHALVLDTAARGGGLGARLLTRALTELAAEGAQVAQMRVDPDNEGALRMLRLLSFEQEDAHACYQIGEWIDPPLFPRG
ncbi:GNAT family N-acetyltransferase [Nocardia higoensis]|uniref:GNAT family N-acetyltransferase n=1 Tax=Nocardia higoensis TaxID=228599 RepID=UPI0002F93B62|nr:GNAT family N-acetyltransferase [Nocardia higoensis]